MTETDASAIYAELRLPAITSGTDKQNAWATDIRRDLNYGLSG